MTVFLRSTVTGKVVTQDEWLHSLNEWEDEGGSSSPVDEFTEVVKNAEGNWVEKNSNSSC